MNSKQFHFSNFHNLNLTVDVVHVISTFIVTIMFYYSDYLQHEIITALEPTATSLGLLSFEILCTISTLRYLSIKKPLLQINPSFVFLALSLELFLSLLFGVAYFLFSKHGMSASLVELNVVTSVVYTFGFVFIITINMKACNLLHFCKKRSGRVDQQIVVSEVKVTIKHKVHAAKTLFIISVFYLICNLPLAFMAFLKTMEDVSDTNATTKWRHYIVWITLVNAGINATVYMLRIREIRCFYKLKVQRILQHISTNDVSQSSNAETTQ